jgi:RNA polymerase sigma factor (sigma-70 family)
VRDSDERVLAASVSDSARFGALVDRHGPALHAYLARRVRVDVADDLLAETWLAAFTSRTRYDRRRGPVRGWLFGVARYTLMAHLRQQRCASAETAAARSGPVLDEEWAAVDARLDAAAASSDLRAGLAALSPADRELLLLVSWEQLSPIEAAAVQGIPAGTARSRLHRARRVMRDHLATEAGPDAARSSRSSQ